MVRKTEEKKLRRQAIIAQRETRYHEKTNLLVLSLTIRAEPNVRNRREKTQPPRNKINPLLLILSNLTVPIIKKRRKY